MSSTSTSIAAAAGYAQGQSESLFRKLLGRYHFLLRRAHSLTGILFGLYLFVHLGINATLVQGSGGLVDQVSVAKTEGVDIADAATVPARANVGPGVFQNQVDKIHGLPFLIGIEVFFIYLPIAYHTVYGAWIVYTGRPNVGAYGYTRNWFYLWQRVTAVVLTFFILFHVLTMKGAFGGELGRLLTFDPHAAYDTTLYHLQAAWWIGWVIYPIGVLTAAFHTANGFFTAAITWGLAVGAPALRRWGVVCGLAFVFLFAGGMTALVAGLSAALPEGKIAPTAAHAMR